MVIGDEHDDSRVVQEYNTICIANHSSMYTTCKLVTVHIFIMTIDQSLRVMNTDTQ